MNEQLRGKTRGGRYCVRGTEAANSASLASESCPFEAKLPTAHDTGSQVRPAYYKFELLAGHALHPVTSRACGIACIIRCVRVLVAGVTIVISCSRRTRR